MCVNFLIYVKTKEEIKLRKRSIHKLFTNTYNAIQWLLQNTLQLYTQLNTVNHIFNFVMSQTLLIPRRQLLYSKFNVYVNSKATCNHSRV